MDVIYERCCGIDVHKEMLTACTFTGVRKKEIRKFGTMTDDILLNKENTSSILAPSITAR